MIGTKTSITATFLALMATSTLLGQAPGSAPSYKSTEILPDHKVAFRIYAPKATSVSVGGEYSPVGQGGGRPAVEAVKDENGLWTAIYGPIAPGYYTYIFNVDGVRTVDPQNPVPKPGLNNIVSLLWVPGPETEFADLKEVPHGELRTVYYDTKTFGGQRRMHVYTPPGYERGTAKYPVLYLIHGGGEDDQAWNTGGRAQFIMDNLVAAGKIKPMIVVMPNGNVVLPPIGPQSNGDVNTPEGFAGRRAQSDKQLDAFTNDLLTDVIPYVETNYRVLTNRENRAIAGFSLGGSETMRTVAAHPDKFAWVAVFSMGLMGESQTAKGSQANSSIGTGPEFAQKYPAFFGDVEKTNKGLRLYYIGAGTQDTIVRDAPKKLDEFLAAQKIRHEYHEMDGPHTMTIWRPMLRDFAEKLFR